MRAECAARCDGCWNTTLDRYASNWIRFSAIDRYGGLHYVKTEVGSKEIQTPREQLDFCTLACLTKFLEDKK